MLALLPLLAPPRVLIVGGGPEKAYNQVAIESNVRYLSRVLPPGTTPRVLFADGDAKSATVRYTPEGRTPGRRDRYRAPNLSRLDGATTIENVRREVGTLASSGTAPVLLYFTGHGSLVTPREPFVSQYDLWGDGELTVPSLAVSLKDFKPSVPVTVLMVQCHSGGFANLLFANGSPDAPLADTRVCGFYASIAARTAAGCTPEIDEADYHDFTGYFLAALTGQDRLGRPSTGADYDKNGRVGMNEAFCWSLVNDDSIDTPVCTSDEFLRHFSKREDANIFATPYADVLKWASPAQRAALEGLSAALKLTTNDRLAVAYARFLKVRLDDEEPNDVKTIRFCRLTKSVVLSHDAPGFPPAARSRYATLLRDEGANPLRP